jgi:hypothetical protein
MFLGARIAVLRIEEVPRRDRSLEAAVPHPVRQRQVGDHRPLDGRPVDAQRRSGERKASDLEIDRDDVRTERGAGLRDRHVS